MVQAKILLKMFENDGAIGTLGEFRYGKEKIRRDDSQRKRTSMCRAELPLPVFISKLVGEALLKAVIEPATMRSPSETFTGVDRV